MISSDAWYYIFWGVPKIKISGDGNNLYLHYKWFEHPLVLEKRWGWYFVIKENLHSNIAMKNALITKWILPSSDNWNPRETLKKLLI